ncbi:MAG: replication initiation protein [Aquificae bacterium]|nr:replication initiation protein [Aquificota bacterium]
MAKKVIAKEPNSMVDLILFQLGEYAGRIKGRGRPRKRGVKDLADIYAIALATARQEEIGVFSYISKEFLIEVVQTNSAKYKKMKANKLFNLAIKLADEANKSIGLDTQKAYEWYKRYGYEELAKEMEADLKKGYKAFRTPLFIKITDGDKVRFIKVKWSPYLAPFILEIKRGFTLYEVKTFLSLDSIYSKKLYRFLKKLQKYGRVEVPIEEIRFFLQVENEYRNFNDLEKRVLKPSVEEINEKTDLFVEYEKKRLGEGDRGSKVIALIFRIKQKPQEGIKDLEKYLKEKPTEDKLLLEEIKEKIKKLLKELSKEIYTYPVWQFKRLDYYDATGGEIELIDYLLEKFNKVNPATVLWYIAHFPQNVDKGKALADALIAEKFEYIDNPEGFLRSKIAFNQRKELKFLLDARVQKLIRNLLEEIKEELLQNIKEQKSDQKEEPSYLEYEPAPEQLFISILTTDAIELLWRALNQEQKRDFFENFLKRHPLLEKFIKDKYSSVEELEEDIKNLTQKFEETLELPWPKKQIARFLNLLEAYVQENNINY